MVKHQGKFELPPNPSLKDINWYKKQLSWGELPPFYHLVAASVNEAEGTFSHGFDNAIKQITNQRNWNLELLGGKTNQCGEIECTALPRIALNQVFSERGFELLAFPYAKDKPIDQYVKDNKTMEFKLWNPQTMRSILRINQLHKFIQFYFHSGDAADKALILHSHKIVFKTIEYLKTKLNVCQVTGISVKEFYKHTETSQNTGEVELALAQMATNDLLLKKD
jgi:hypothetical protein